MKNNYGLKGPCWNKSVWITYVIVWLKRSYICCKVLKNTHCKFPTRCVCRTIWSALKVVSTGVSLFQMTHKYFMPKFGSIRQYLLVTQIDKIPHFKWNLEKLNKGEEKKLQQTSIPRLIARLPRYSHIFSYIKEHLHWLPISTRIEYKVLLIVLKAQMRVAPKYLRDAIRLPTSATSLHPLRSMDRRELFVPRTRTTMATSRSFCRYCRLPPSARVSLLSSNLSTSLSLLKTCLFSWS